MKEILMYNQSSGTYKTIPLGFSWTTLFFGIFPALFRSDWKWAGIQFLTNIVCMAVFGGLALSILVWPFFYNKLYLTDMIDKGYVPRNADDINYLLVKGYINSFKASEMNDKFKNI